MRVPTPAVYLSLQSGPRHFYEQDTLCSGMCWSIRPRSEDNNIPYRVTQTLRAHLLVFFVQKYTNDVVWIAILLCGKHCLNIEYCFEGLGHLKRSFNITVGWGYTVYTDGYIIMYFSQTPTYNVMSRVLYAWVFQKWAWISSPNKGFGNSIWCLLCCKILFGCSKEKVDGLYYSGSNRNLY